MREIKFRAWNKDDESMMSQMLLSWDGSRFYNEVDNELTIMQYTGLKDKNGVEIYEGDVIKQRDYIRKEGGYSYEQVQYDGDRFFPRGMTDPYFSGEVIGNVFENPELLEK